MTVARCVMLASLLKQMAGYGIASLLALAVDFSIYAALVHFLNFGYVAAATLSFSAGVFVAYSVSTRIAFTQHRLGNAKTEFLVFAAIGIVGLLVNDAVIGFATSHAGMNFLAAKLAATGFTFLCNFFLRRQILFVRARRKQETQVATE